MPEIPARLGVATHPEASTAFLFRRKSRAKKEALPPECPGRHGRYRESMKRPIISDETEARRELGPKRTKPECRISTHLLPFSDLSDDEFEILCFLLLSRENSNDKVYYYGKTGDAGRDIVRVRPDGKYQIVQCKRYSRNVGVGPIRGELGKLYCNIFAELIPKRPEEVVFYVAPDLTSRAIDLTRDPAKWRAVASDALRAHLRNRPSEDLLKFAKSWWPELDYQNALRLTERLSEHPDLIDEFFGVRKVVDASRQDIRDDLSAQIMPVRDELVAIRSLVQSKQENRAVSASRLNCGQLRTLFRKASRSLLTWPATLGVGKDIHILRAELGGMTKRIQSVEASTTVLLGSSGGGKSALLAVLGERATQAGFSVLAVKADKLLLTIDSRAALAQELRLPDFVEACVCHLAAEGKVLVLLDQLDALAALVDLRSERLNVLLDLIHDLHGTRNVHVVCSCREFDFRHDVRLAAIEAEEVSLSLPSWDTVAEVLRGAGIDASGWPEPLRESLRPPQHLKVFLERFRGTSEDQVFSSYQQMLDDLWQQKVTNPEGLAGRSQLLLDIAAKMSEEECLWLPAARFEDREQIVRSLEAAGILTRPDGGPRISFQHQTLFEHARARAFARGNGSLSSYVLKRQDSLFVRPTLWSTLNYLRGAARTTYAAEMRSLLAEPLRLHVKYLLIEFLGQVRDPGDDEAVWMFDWINDPECRAKALSSLRGNAGWFARIRDTHLPALMASSRKQLGPVTLVLGEAWAFARRTCIDLVRSVWLGDEKYDPLVLTTLQQVNDWDEDTLRLAVTVVSRADVNDGFAALLAAKISKQSPAMVPRFLASHLMRQLTALEATPDPVADPLPAEATELDRLFHGVSHRTNERFCDYLNRHDSFYDLPEIAKAAPAEFLKELWPWFLRALSHVLQEPHSMVREYRRDECLGSTLAEVDQPYHPLFHAMENGIRGLAKADYQSFLAFARESRGFDSMVVQRLLCRGFSEVVEATPGECLEFLMADSRRLNLGCYEDEQGDTRLLISRLEPYLGVQQMQCLERAVLDWSGFGPAAGDEEASMRSGCEAWDRKHRLRLLKAIPLHRLSADTQALVKAEGPSTGQEHTPACAQVTLIGSPASAEQIAGLSSDDIVGLLETLPDDTGSYHPDHHFLGGSIHLSYELGEFAKKNPSRAVALLPRFSPGRQERPAGHVIRALGEIDFPASQLYELIVDLDSRGFSRAEFRDGVGHALMHRAGVERGFPDIICEMLERWLASSQSPVDDRSEDENQSEPEKPQSVLWRRGSVTLPNGNYPILRSLTYGLLRREPPLQDRWLRDLETHVERSESTRVWQILAEDLRLLRLCGRDRAAKFLARLFERFPKARDSRFGAILLAQLRSFLPAGTFRSFLESVRDGGWRHGPQAYGEVLTLTHLTRKLRWPRRDIEDLLSASTNSCEESGRPPVDQVRDASKCLAVQVGIAFAAGKLWKEQNCRQRATDLIVRLSATAKRDLAAAIMDVFRVTDRLYYDDSTRRLLDAVAAKPELICAMNDSFLVQRLEGLATAERERVHRIGSEIVRLRGDEVSGIRGSFMLAAPYLTNIAITLQRTGGEYREKGLQLFEQLLVLGVPDAQSLLDELDRRPRNVRTRAATRRPQR
jgi:hypothetical protein